MRKVALVLLLGLVLAALYFFVRGGAGEPVSVAAVERGAVSENLDEDGLVKSELEADLAPRIQGRLGRLLVKSGQQVRRGQLLAQLDQDDLQAAVDAAVANQRAAEAGLEQARARAALEREAAAAELSQSEAGRQVAAANLSRIQEGPRHQEIATARAQLAAAEASEREARANLARSQQLFDQGYVSAQQVDASRTALGTASANRQQARNQLSTLLEGSRSQETDAARGELSRSQAQVEAARARQHSVAAAEEEVSASLARLESSRASLEQARANRGMADLRAPANGEILLEEIEPGEVLGPNTRLGRLIDPDHVWVEMLLDENDRGKVAVGQAVVITTDAYPGVEFQGQVESIESLAQLKRQLRGTPTQDEDRVFRSRIRLEQARQEGGRLYPGMSVFAEVVLRRLEGVLSVPREALVSREGKWVVLLVEGGRAVERVVKTGSRDANRVEVVEGLREGDRVVLNPGNLRDGVRVTVRP